MPDDHSEVVPLLPIPNRTVKRFSADDSADSRVKVGHCQAFIAVKSPSQKDGLFLCAKEIQYLQTDVNASSEKPLLFRTCYKSVIVVSWNN